jgi:signal transduction histidine kinase
MFETLGAQIGLYLDRVGALEHARAALRERDEFISVATHELRTPLTGLYGFAQLAQRWLQKGDLERARASIERVVVQADRAAKLIASLLDSAKADVGKMSLDRADVDLVAIVGAVVASRVAPEQERISVTAAGSAVAWADATRVEQVVNNLIDNALKYSQQGAPIDVDVSEAQDAWRVSVRDRGIGVAPADRERIFDRFYQARPEAGGLGLGLYVSRQIARMHGGDLVYEAPADGGSRFVLILRRAGATVAT